MIKFLQIVQMLPAIIGTVKAVEEALPLPGQGKAKFDAVLGIITDTVDEVDKVVPQVTSVITRLVALFNGTGLFKKA